MVWGNRRIYRQGLYGGVDGDVGGRWVWATVSFKQQFTWHDTSGFGRLYKRTTLDLPPQPLQVRLYLDPDPDSIDY